MAPSSLPPIIAVVGCDGSGKSTMTHALQAWLAESRPTVVCHLGKQSGNMGRALARLPLFGNRLERSLHQKAQTAQTGKGPSLATAIGIYAFSVRRVRRFRRRDALVFELAGQRRSQLVEGDRLVDGPGGGKRFEPRRSELRGVRGDEECRRGMQAPDIRDRGAAHPGRNMG